MQKSPVASEPRRRDRLARLEDLRQQHAKLETRLKELEKHLALSPDEQRERSELKKAKLQLKDTMLQLQRDN